MKKREEYLKQKKLEEARKQGMEEPEKDEEGRDINPHIPQYISKAPWYINRGVPSLSHQRLENQQEQQQQQSLLHHQKVVTGVATKYRKGACENCGSISHKTKDCLERKRLRGAKITGKDIAPDEAVIAANLDFEGKRDRWNGYEAGNYKEVLDHYQKVELERRKLRAAKLAEDQKRKAEAKERGEVVDDSSTKTSANDDSDDSDEELDEDKEISVSGKAVSKVPLIRIREDTAKYLQNLDLTSAHYDPKTRSMRENPNSANAAEQVYRGDNALRYSGDFVNFVQVQRFAWEAADRGQDINLAAVPSQAELMFKTVKDRKNMLKNSQKSAILEKYGGEEHLQKPQELNLAQTEHYVEYGPDGRVVGGKSQAVPKSIYEEDVHVNGHAAVWGSYYENGKWGYACCKSLNRDGWCTVAPDAPAVPSIKEGQAAAVSSSSQVLGKARERDGGELEHGQASKKQRVQ